MGDNAGDWFGYSVSISGDGTRVAIGAPRYDDGIESSNTGQTKVFEYNSGTWVPIGSPIIGEGEFDQSGFSVSLSYDGNIVTIGAIDNVGTNGTESGHVRLYTFSSGEWNQLGEDIDGEAADDDFGYAVSLSDDGLVVAVGARYNDGINRPESGHARVYTHHSGNWTQRGQDLDGEAANDRFGCSVSLSGNGNIVAVGAHFNNGANGAKSGHVRVGEYNSILDKWLQLGGDIDGETQLDNSGESVSLSTDGTILAIGAPWNGDSGDYSGHVRIYRFDSNSWLQVANDIDGESEYDGSGWSVSLSSDGMRVAIGAPQNDGSGDESGHVRLYELRGDL